MLSGTVVEDVLTMGQKSLDLIKGVSPFTITYIRYEFDLANHTCADARFICARFDKGRNPFIAIGALEYHFEARPTEAVLTGCTEISDCEGGFIFESVRKELISKIY